VNSAEHGQIKTEPISVNLDDGGERYREMLTRRAKESGIGYGQ
jgi:hypothetical protein